MYDIMRPAIIKAIFTQHHSPSDLLFRIVFMGLLASLICACTPSEEKPEARSQSEYTGASNCRPCHEKFYQLWASSWHALAMQETNSELAMQPWIRTAPVVNVATEKYQMRTDGQSVWVELVCQGDSKRYEVSQIMGGKNVYYFLTPFDRGRLQVLPVAYDVNRKEWFDTAGSGVRHFLENRDQALHWTDRSYAFNTTCYGCHVSQLSHNYDVRTDTYLTTWKEPGINCETCHGPGEKHIKVCEEAPKKTVPANLMTLRGGRDFSADQNNANCAQCHAKAALISSGFSPGELFADHFDLVTLEDNDYYPDGRDLGENYSYTSWLMSPCVAAGELDCLHCHTSSGRFRQKENPNESCLPCHQKHVSKAKQHTMHKDGPDSPTCISCHMPMTEFARMRRSDHSMLPPTPATTLEFGSPNACNICHKDKNAKWANKKVRTWRKRDYQAPALQRARLIDAARKGNWVYFDEMITLVESGSLDQVNTASFLRLLRNSNDPRRWKLAASMLTDSSPLVRTAAVSALEGTQEKAFLELTISACNDKSRAVRIQAASILSQYQLNQAPNELRKRIKPAMDELVATFNRRPDLWASHFNAGNFHMNQGELKLAIAAFDVAAFLEPTSSAPLVNAAMAHARLKEPDKALEKLVQAETISPKDMAVQYNLGLLYAEMGKKDKATEHMRKAYIIAPNSAGAAFNLGMLTVGTDKKKGLALLKKAMESEQSNQRYAKAYRYYLKE